MAEVLDAAFPDLEEVFSLEEILALLEGASSGAEAGSSSGAEAGSSSGAGPSPP
jgi:hypothetical protein